MTLTGATFVARVLAVQTGALRACQFLISFSTLTVIGDLHFAFRLQKQRESTTHGFFCKGVGCSFLRGAYIPWMRKYKPPPKKVHRRDKRTGDDFIREWAASVGSVREAERRAGMYRGNLHNWLVEPDKRFNSNTTLKLAIAASCPPEALEYRWTPIKDLQMWKYMEAKK
jgi:hypothetical protein